jgi:hypothetical protein
MQRKEREDDGEPEIRQADRNLQKGCREKDSQAAERERITIACKRRA